MIPSTPQSCALFFTTKAHTSPMVLNTHASSSQSNYTIFVCLFTALGGFLFGYGEQTI